MQDKVDVTKMDGFFARGAVYIGDIRNRFWGGLGFSAGFAIHWSSCMYRYFDVASTHMQRHLGIKPFSCEFCQKSFVRKEDMRSHMRVHTGARLV